MIRALIVTLVLVLVIMLALDFAWLSLTAEALYRPNMAGLMRAKPDLVPAAAFYLLYGISLTWLVLLPVLFGGRGRPSLIDLSIRSALFGLTAYGTYDLTALAVIRDWPLRLSLIDMAWGMVITLTTALLTAGMLKVLKLRL